MPPRPSSEPSARLALLALLALPLLAPAAGRAVEFAATPADLTFDTNIPASVDLPRIKDEGGCLHEATQYSLSPTPPAGLTFDGGFGQSVTLRLSGTPTTVTAEAGYTYSATSHTCTGGAQTVTATFNITVQAGQPTLLPSSVTSTGASLNLVNHTGTYYLKGTGRNSYSHSCASATAGTAVSLTGLTENSTYIFSAYSASGCSGDALHSLTFTTPGSVSVWIHDVEYDDAVVELGGWSSGSDKWSYDLTSPTDTGSERVSGPLACRDNTGGRLGSWRGNPVAKLLTDTEYTLRAYWGAGCQVLNRLGQRTFRTKPTTEALPALSFSNITSTSVQLVYSNTQGEFWWERDGDPDTCTHNNAARDLVVTGLSPNTTYGFTLYDGSVLTCSAYQDEIPWYAMSYVTTTGSLSIAVSNKTSTGFKVTLSGHTDDATWPRTWALNAARKLNDGSWDASTCYIKDKSDTTVRVSGLTAGQTYTINVYRKNDCRFVRDRATFSTTTTSLTSSVDEASATLSLNEYDGAWSYRGQLASGSAASASAATARPPGAPEAGLSLAPLPPRAPEAGLNLAPLPLGAPAPSPAPGATPRSGEPEPLGLNLAPLPPGAPAPSPAPGATPRSGEPEPLGLNLAPLPLGAPASSPAPGATPRSGEPEPPASPSRRLAERPAHVSAAAVDQCRAMPAGTYEAELSDLAASTSYAFTAYNDHVCLGDELGATTVVTPENWGDSGPELPPGWDDGDPGDGGDDQGGGGDGGQGDDDNDDDDTGGFGGDGPDPVDPAPRWVGDLALEVAGKGALALHWRGDWQDAGGELTVEARTQRRGWHDMTAADASLGELLLSALSPEAPYTFRLRRETADGEVERSPEMSAVTDPWRGRCRGGARYMCLRDRRFEVRAHWSNPDIPGDVGNGGAVKTGISDESGLFWFFDPANVELVVKVLDGRALNGRHWLLYGGLSDVEYTLTATDTLTGLTKVYGNERGSLCGGVDPSAF